MPGRLICDNEAEISRRGRSLSGCRVLRDVGDRLHQPQAPQPGVEGIAERHNVFFETSFVPGRTFAVVSITGGGNLCAAAPP